MAAPFSMSASTVSAVVSLLSRAVTGRTRSVRRLWDKNFVQDEGLTMNVPLSHHYGVGRVGQTVLILLKIGAGGHHQVSCFFCPSSARPTADFEIPSLAAISR